jgi:hypothetical protein
VAQNESLSRPNLKTPKAAGFFLFRFQPILRSPARGSVLIRTPLHWH